MFNIFKKFSNSNNKEIRPLVLKYGKAQSNMMSVEDIFLENPCVNRALNIITSSISNLEVVILKNGSIDYDSIVYKILKNPSKGVFTSDFIESFVLNYLLYGNAFIFLDSNNNLTNLYSDSVKIHIEKSSNLVSFYSIKINETQVIKVFNDSAFPLIGHFKNSNPYNSLYGYSVLDPIQVCATLYQHIDRHNLSLIQNAGRPSGIVTASPSQPLDKEEEEVLRKQFEDQYLGPDHAGKIIFLNKEFSWQQLSSSSKDMDYNDASRRALRAIAAGLGVPANLIGDMSMVGENAKSNIESMFEIFHTITIEPLAKKISQFLTMFFNDIDSEIEVKLMTKSDLLANYMNNIQE